MPTIERTVVLGGRDANGNETIYYPVTKLKNIDGSAEVKNKPKSADYVPVIDMEDGGKMKKMSLLSVVGDPTVFTPSVSESGVISWTNDGGLANPSPVNISGPTPDIHVGEITTLIAGSDATVNRKPDSSNADPVLEFGIPRGADAVSSSTPAISFYLQNDHLMMKYEGDENTPVPTPIVKPDGHLYLTYTLDINVFKIYFDDEFIGQPFTVTDGADETKTGIVPKSGITEVNICGCNTTYTISAQAGGVTYSSTITTGPDYRQYSIGFVTDISIIPKVPSQNGSLTYTGDEQTPSWNNYNTDMLTIDGVTSAINAGIHKAIFRPKNGYIWKNGTKLKTVVLWSIARANIYTVPSTSDTFTYTGSVQSPTWNNYDSDKLIIGGDTSGTNAGSYTTTFTPTSNYQWPDGTTGAKSVTWSIGKIDGSLSIDKTSMSLSASNLTGTITVTRAGNGAITASSSNTSVATVSVSGTTVTVTANGDGNATITISVAAGTNHNAPASKTCSVIAAITSSTLANNTPAIIQKAARAGKAANYWSVGDKIGITLNGTVGSLSLNDTYYAFIIGFNHNSTYEGSNSIHFQFGKTSDGTDICFANSSYYGVNGTTFMMNSSSIGNAGGWSSSYMRNTICSSFFYAMPLEWRNVIAYCNKYSDNTGGGGANASHITSTADKIWLLSEYEVFGTYKYASSYEENYQSQYTYYSGYRSKIKYVHSHTSMSMCWWLRSVSVSYRTDRKFCCVDTSGAVTDKYCYYGFGIAPGFMVA